MDLLDTSKIIGALPRISRLWFRVLRWCGAICWCLHVWYISMTFHRLAHKAAKERSTTPFSYGQNQLKVKLDNHLRWFPGLWIDGCLTSTYPIFLLDAGFRHVGTSLLLFSFPLACFLAITCRLLSSTSYVCSVHVARKPADKEPVIRISVKQMGVHGPLQFRELRFTFNKTTFLS